MKFDTKLTGDSATINNEGRSAMNYVKTMVLLVFGLLITITLVYAEGNVARGKKLFNDPTFADSANAKSCNSCHPGGTGMEDVAEDYADNPDALKKQVNACIQAALKGKPIETSSQEMKDIIAYMKSLGAK